MAIEREIKQQKFKNSYHKLAISLMYSTSLLEGFIKDHLKKENITLQQYNILRILRGSMRTPLSTLQIRERMIDKMSDTSRIVDRLVIKKLVSKKISTKDQRLVDVKITEKGLKLLKKADDIEERLVDFFSGLSEKQATKISNCLGTLLPK